MLRTVNTTADLASVCADLIVMPRPFTVAAGADKKRTDAQNRTIHKWFSEIAEQRSDVTSDEVKAECNLMFGRPILDRDDPDWRAVFGYLFDNLDYEKKLKAIRVLDVPFTRRMKVKQLKEYMDWMQSYAIELEWTLTQPEDAG